MILLLGSFHVKWSGSPRSAITDFNEILYEHSHMSAMNIGKVLCSAMQYFRGSSHLFDSIPHPSAIWLWCFGKSSVIFCWEKQNLYNFLCSFKSNIANFFISGFHIDSLTQIWSKKEVINVKFHQCSLGKCVNASEVRPLDVEWPSNEYWKRKSTVNIKKMWSDQLFSRRRGVHRPLLLVLSVPNPI